MDKNRDLRHLLPADEEISNRRVGDDKVREQTQKSAQDTRKRIRDAFSLSEKLKASLRP
ncbi:hypothetical protein J5N58_03475 [Rhizobium cremeum]|uniref:hypothetical protein n=1 Tax=Rhizobium cremeum TaxID=2813827 RepID=UPI001FD23A77|nr:hypothetical protein [Rhizobium cremeum]MCJ7993671.1 hypothetical protein [Rhizobium cremeum]MCJ7998728.1 hypothetical protein [Rhizobium cremeum]